MAVWRRAALPLAVHLGALLPLLLLGLDWWRQNLTANPIQAATLRTGYPALVLLVLCLACTPLNTLTGWRAVIGVRRALGLYAFLYAIIHLAIFVWLDYGFDARLLWSAVSEKRFVLAGLGALLLLTPLAITSTRGWQRRLGKTWKRLHQLIYLAALLAIAHYLWLVKSDYRQPLAYGLLVLLLLALRLPALRQWLAQRRRRPSPVRTAARQHGQPSPGIEASAGPERSD